MSPTIEVYFHIPEKRQTMLIEAYVDHFDAAKLQHNVELMTDAPAQIIDKPTYVRLTRLYTER